MNEKQKEMWLERLERIKSLGFALGATAEDIELQMSTAPIAELRITISELYMYTESTLSTIDNLEFLLDELEDSK